MSQHGYPERLSGRSKALQDEGLCQSTIEVLVETLTGTAFEMTVSPTDTIFAIKSKIFRVEGIPISQQHLLYNLKELDDSSSLKDYSIKDGSTLRLVLSMRGGPVSIRRLPLPSVDDIHWKDIRDFVESNREEALDWLPPGCKVTVLVFRDGENVNLVKVIDNEDGTYSPLAEGLTANGSLKNLLDDSGDDGITNSLEENAITMGKMNELKRKMGNLSIHRNKKTLYSHEEENAEPVQSLHKTLSEETLSTINSLFDDMNDLSKYKADKLFSARNEVNDNFSPIYDGSYTRYDYDCSFSDRYTLLPPISGYSDAGSSDYSPPSTGRDWRVDMGDFLNDNDMPHSFSKPNKERLLHSSISMKTLNSKQHYANEGMEPVAEKSFNSKLMDNHSIPEDGQDVLEAEELGIAKIPLAPQQHASIPATEFAGRVMVVEGSSGSGGASGGSSGAVEALVTPQTSTSTAAQVALSNTGVSSSSHTNYRVTRLVEEERPTTSPDLLYSLHQPSYSGDQCRRFQLRKIIFGSNSHLNNSLALNRNINRPNISRESSHSDSLNSSVNDILGENIGASTSTLLGSEPQLNKLHKMMNQQVKGRKKSSKLSHSVSNLYLNTQKCPVHTNQQEFSSSSNLDKTEVTVAESIFPTINSNNMVFSSSTSDLENLKRNKILPSLSRHRNFEHLDISDECLDRVTITKHENVNYCKEMDSSASRRTKINSDGNTFKRISGDPSWKETTKQDFASRVSAHAPQPRNNSIQTYNRFESRYFSDYGQYDVDRNRNVNSVHDIQRIRNDSFVDDDNSNKNNINKMKSLTRNNRSLEVGSERRYKRIKKLLRPESNQFPSRNRSPVLVYRPPLYELKSSALETSTHKSSDNVRFYNDLGVKKTNESSHNVERKRCNLEDGPSGFDGQIGRLMAYDHSYSMRPDMSNEYGDHADVRAKHISQNRMSPEPPLLNHASILPDIVSRAVVPKSSESHNNASKKSSRVRCGFCNKRLSIATVHTCRCGVVFCAPHRYSEVHGCSYDYKTEGQKYLEQANPLVSAPKLPKI